MVPLYVRNILTRAARDDGYREWAASQRRPVEILHCGLFLLGSLLVFDSYKDFSTSPSAEEWPKVAVEALLVLLHAACLFCLWRGANESWKQYCHIGIRLIGVFSFFVADKEGYDAVGRYWEGTLLRVVVCPVGLQWQVVVSMVETLVACIQGGRQGLRLVSPVFLAYVLEWVLSSDYDAFKKSLVTEPVHPKGKAETMDTSTTTRCAQEAGGSGSGVYSRPMGPCTSPAPVIRSRQRPVKSESKAKLKVDISRLLTQSSTDNAPPSFARYRPVVAVDIKTIKVFNTEATETEIQRFAGEFALSIASKRQERGRLTNVKGVGVRGCILLMAGVMDSESAKEVMGRGQFDEAAQELISCLPEDLKGQDMDVTINGLTGRFVQGQSEPVSIWEVSESGMELPEVNLVSEPCAIMSKHTNLDISFSDSIGDWESIKVVLVLEDEVLQTQELEFNSARLQVHGTEEQKFGYIRTVGLTKSSASGRGQTVVSSMAPFLRMPKAEAQELNGLFEKTVLDAVRNIGSTHEVQSKNVWRQRFKPFALDMQYVLGVGGEELRSMMTNELFADQKDEYLGVFLKLTELLKHSEADLTHRYLWKVMEDAGIELVNGDEKCESEEHAPVLESHEKPYVQDAGHKPYVQDAGPSHGEKLKPGFDEHMAPNYEGSVNMDFTFWRGFKDPALEAQYKLHLSQNLVLVDFVGTIMGLCLLPLMWQFVKDGGHLYLCPLMTHFLVCTSWFLCSERTYVHSRQPVVVLLWIVRMAVFVGQVAYEGWHVLVASSMWNMAALMVWFVLVKPWVMKMPLSDFMLLSTLDLAGWLGIMIISFFCQDFGAGATSFGLALACVGVSCAVGYYSETRDRTNFASNIEIMVKPSSSK